MTRRVGVRVLAVAALAIGPSERVEAHWSASRGTSLYVERYLICNDQPEMLVHCAGPIRARKAVLDALADPLADESRAHAAAVDAVYFNIREAIPALRAMLALRPAPAERDQHSFMVKQGLRGQAAYALAHLGDPTSIDEIAALVLEYETDGHGFLWRDTLEALAVIDPRRASRYALAFLKRARDFRMSLPGGSSKLGALDFIRRDHAAAALPVLKRLAKETWDTYDHAYCEFMATAIRLDDRMRADVRRQLLGSYGGSWLPLCVESVLRRLGLPADPADAAALVRHLGRSDRGMDFGVANLAYQRVLDVIATSRDAAARRVLKRGLVERSKWPHVADPSHANFSLHFVAFHHAALAGLGDAAARGKLYGLIDDPKERSGAAWLAAYWALQLDLDGAQKHVADLIVRSVRYGNSERSGVYQNIRGRVLDLYVAKHPGDPGWTVMLLDGDVNLAGDPSEASERALYHLSRRKPAGTCDAVTAAAPFARTEAANHALLALTVLGDACRPALAVLFDSKTTPPEIRGAALEILGVLRDPDLKRRLAVAAEQDVWRPAIDRARLWL